MMNKLILNARWKQVRGRCRKAWGRWTRNVFQEFRGEREIVDGKLEEHYARNAAIRDNAPCMLVGGSHDRSGPTQLGGDFAH
jgi:uncharacterized protein YjbJ (UPF0337 family)